MNRLVVVLSLFVLPVVSSLAQVPRVYRDRVEPVWFQNNTKFWYRVNLPRGNFEFVLVDTDEGTRKPAFDHVRVAEGLRTAG